MRSEGFAFKGVLSTAFRNEDGNKLSVAKVTTRDPGAQGVNCRRHSSGPLMIIEN